jgi:inner membrane protein
MASIISHAVFGVGIGLSFMPRDADRRYVWLGGATAVLPDLDTLGGLFGRSGTDLFAHRGLSHSIAFAVVIGALLSVAVSRMRPSRTSPRRLFCCISLAMMSHGLIDTTTTYGRGVALLAPFSTERFVSPFRPLGTPALRGQHTRTERVTALVLNELVWVWAPAITLALAVRATRRTLEGRTRDYARTTTSSAKP